MSAQTEFWILTVEANNDNAHSIRQFFEKEVIRKSFEIGSPETTRVKMVPLGVIASIDESTL